MFGLRNFGWLAAALAISAGAAEPPTLPAAAARVAAILEAAHLPGEVALADQTGVIVDQVFGLADRAANRAHRPGERWLWASVTKQVTAILILQQVEAGRLALDSPIRTYLPNFPGQSGDRVTLRHLLQHTSGLPNPDDTPPDGEGVPSFYSQRGDVIGNGARTLGYCAGTAKAEPGAGFSYNNCDYLVLGALLERVTGQSFASLIDERLARPLGLASLALARDGSVRGHSDAVGYAEGGAIAPALNLASFGAAGALTGTARDLVLLDRALVGGKLLKPESRAILWQGDAKLGYEALGAWSFAARLRGCAEPIALIERRGDIGGIQVRNVIAPQLGRSLALFTNDGVIEFGEVWQGTGLSTELLSAAFCLGR